MLGLRHRQGRWVLGHGLARLWNETAASGREAATPALFPRSFARATLGTYKEVVGQNAADVAGVDASACCAPSCATAVAPAASASCSGFPEFSVLSQGVTAACCGAGAECPPGGIPTTCTKACAAVLLPMQAACADVLAEIGMAETVAAAVATCPTQCAPPPADTRSADCKAADIDDETKAALCRGEPQSRCSLRRS